MRPKRSAPKRIAIRTDSGIVVKSRFEKRVADDLSKRNIKWRYEKRKLKYVVPASNHEYTPDFELRGRTWVLECKGVLDLETRKKMLHVKESNPDVDVRLLFQRNNPIRKGSKKTYGMWADEHGFKWAVGQVPEEWVREDD